MSDTPSVREYFLRETDSHILSVIKDDGAYRHWRYAIPGDSMYSMDLITWPGHLSIGGDIGDYVFARRSDMLSFFRQESFAIQSESWAKACIAADTNCGLYDYDKEACLSAVDNYLESIEYELADHSPSQLAEFRQAIDEVRGEIASAGSADYAKILMRDFHYEFDSGAEFSLADASDDNDFLKPGFHFEFALYGIVKMIQLHDALTPQQTPGEGTVYVKSSSSKSSLKTKATL